jgi:hypothetical protein
MLEHSKIMFNNVFRTAGIIVTVAKGRRVAKQS